jgi:hypothetical protein
LLFMLLAGETFNRFQLRISWPAFNRAPAARGR